MALHSDHALPPSTVVADSYLVHTWRPHTDQRLRSSPQCSSARLAQEYLGTRTPGKNDVRLYRDHLGICRYGFRSLYALGCHYPIRARYGGDLWISSDRSPRVAAPQADATSPHISDPLGCITGILGDPASRYIRAGCEWANVRDADLVQVESPLLEITEPWGVCGDQSSKRSPTQGQ
jgi:hypothetical protein